ncbi:PfkB family carbohydrate kinase [Brachybacterium sp. GPGPB12]|uniref:PfkB family carbohydrate kinase n=1 Tax=Brachybacterium sp. GPGPB12 TaxID=3023517 RepID=UPI0031343B59
MTAATASSPDGTIVVVGSVNVDLLAQVRRHPRPGETAHGTGGQMLPGGKGANQAVAAARLGARVAMVGAVGSDVQAEAAVSARARPASTSAMSRRSRGRRDWRS